MVYYIDGTSGSDSATGLSERSAWKTVENLRTVKLKAGDKVLFKRGEVYTVDCLTLTCSGKGKTDIVISAYGEGDKPILTTSEKTEVLRLVDCSYVTVSDLEITSCNIGCYGGSGEGKAPVKIFDGIWKLINSVLGRLVQVISDLSNRYWLF